MNQIDGGAARQPVQSNPSMHDPWSQQFTSWQRGGQTLQPEITTGRHRRGTLARWLIALTLVGLVGALALAPRPAVHRHSELDFIPRDAFALVCVRPAQLESHAELSELCKLLGITPEANLPIGANLSVADIERISLVALEPPTNLVLTESIPHWLLVSTTKDYNAEAILQGLGGGKEQSWLQKSYIQLDQPAGLAVHFAHDRLMVFGPEQSVRDFLGRKPEANKELFSEAVAYAQDPRFPLVVCVNLMPALTQWFGQQTAEVMPFFQLDAAMFALEAGDPLQAKVRLEFATEKVARMAGNQLRNGTRLGRQALSRWQARAGKDDLDPVLYRIAEAQLADLHVEERGRDIRLALSLMPEHIATLGESLKARYANSDINPKENNLIDDLSKVVDFAVAGFGVGKGRQLALAMEGKLAPDFLIKDLHGREFHLKDAIGKRPVIIEFGSFT